MSRDTRCSICGERVYQYTDGSMITHGGHPHSHPIPVPDPVRTAEEDEDDNTLSSFINLGTAVNSLLSDDTDTSSSDNQLDTSTPDTSTPDTDFGGGGGFDGSGGGDTF